MRTLDARAYPPTTIILDVCQPFPIKTGPFCHLIMVTQRARGTRASGGPVKCTSTPGSRHCNVVL